MQNETYNSEEVKRYFRYYVLGLPSSNTKRAYSEYLHYIDQPRIVQETINRYKLYRINIILFILLLFTPLFYLFLVNSPVILLAYFLPLLVLLCIPMVIINSKLRALNGYQGLENYFLVKKSLWNGINELKNGITLDIHQEGISLENMNNINSSISKIQTLVTLLGKSILLFQNSKFDHLEKSQYVIEKFITIETSWLISYIKEFQSALSLWIENHKAELSQYQKSYLNTRNQEIFSLVSSRLLVHIESLEKVKVKL